MDNEVEATPIPGRRVRGKGKKPTMANTSVRLDKDTIEFFRATYGKNMQKMMREVLRIHAEEQQRILLITKEQ